MKKNSLRDFKLLQGDLWYLVYRFFIPVMLLLSSCGQRSKTKQVTAGKDVYYTCSMHLQVIETHPGNCPVCGMQLIAVPKSSTNVTTQVRLSEGQIRLGDIQLDTIQMGSIGDRTIITGTLNFNQDRLSSVSARLEGRIVRLYFKSVGDYVHKGDKLYDLYSELLNNAKQEYVTALQQEETVGSSIINYGALVESAKHKLLLWGMSNEEISQLAKNKQVSTITSFYSAEEGYITTLNVKEGDYIMDGGTIIQLANLSTLWAEGQVYTTQLSSLGNNENVAIQIPGLNNTTISGRIDFVNPEINPDTRISLVRATIQNINNQLHPGMPVYIIANHKTSNSIVLPLDAVLTDDKGSLVWVQVRPGIYEVRMVRTGVNDGNTVEITFGLKTGDVVVTSGAYLINSEYIFEHGNNPMEAMDMSSMKM